MVEELRKEVEGLANRISVLEKELPELLQLTRDISSQQDLTLTNLKKLKASLSSILKLIIGIDTNSN